MKIEKGEIYDNDLIYINLSKKLHRSFEFNTSYNQIILDSTKIFLNNLYNYNYLDIQHIYQILNNIKNTSHLYYRETFHQILNCIEYIFYIKKLDISLFQNLNLYFHLLPESLQLVFCYTLSLYYFHKELDIKIIRFTLSFFNNGSHPCIQELRLLYYLHQNNELEFKLQLKKCDFSLSFYNHLYQLWFNCKKIDSYFDYKKITVNPLLKEEIKASLGFLYVLNEDFNQAFDHFHNCHSQVLLKYLPALYTISKVVQPSFWKIKMFLKEIEDTENLFHLILLYNEHPNRDLKNKIVTRIETYYLPAILYQYQSPFHSYTKEFFCLLFIDLNKEKRS